MKHEDLPRRWKGKIVSYLKSTGEERAKLTASDFFSEKKLC